MAITDCQTVMLPLLKFLKDKHFGKSHLWSEDCHVETKRGGTY